MDIPNHLLTIIWAKVRNKASLEVKSQKREGKQESKKTRHIKGFPKTNCPHSQNNSGCLAWTFQNKHYLLSTYPNTYAERDWPPNYGCQCCTLQLIRTYREHPLQKQGAIAIQKVEQHWPRLRPSTRKQKWCQLTRWSFKFSGELH